MKNLFIKKSLAFLSVSAASLLLAACGSAGETETPDESNETATSTSQDKEVTSGGTIMWLSNLSSGVQYETAVAYAEMITEELGYEFQVVYGDMFNDPAGNLSAVRNGMTSDVVGIVMSQDGGLKDIMAEYPELYVAGYNADFRSVFEADGANADVVDNENFLGTIADGFYDGTNLGQQYADSVIEKGYKNISIVQFPAFAYPNLGEAEVAFREAIEEYNASVGADEQITIVGDTRVLEFEPLSESYFLEEGKSELDALVGFLAGVDFVYPTMVTAMANNTASPDMKLITGGFNDNPDIISNVGGEGVIQFIGIGPTENIAYSLILLDNALTDGMYSDFEMEALDSVPYEIDSKEAIDNVMSKSMTGTGDVSLTQMPMEDIKEVLTRFNSDATYASLKELFQSDQLTVEALEAR